MKRTTRWVFVIASAWCSVGGARAQTGPDTGVYTCIDAKGRKLTADRPIPECIDREQRILNPSGTVRGKLGPTLTPLENIEQEKKDKQAADEQLRVVEEKRRDKALLIRYPDRAVHDQERAEALKQIAVMSSATVTRLEELLRQRATLDEQMDFYKKDPSKAPAYLRRQLEDNNNSQAVQKRFISDQEAEVRRVNVRFDDELVRLRRLWLTVSK